MEAHTSSVADHYKRDEIAAAIVSALQRAGKDVGGLTIDDLAPADEVHTRGREATVEVASLTEFGPDLSVIDVGSGVGGPARYLATAFGCRVTGVDLTPAFVEAATALTELVGLSDRVDFHNASALDMPFEDAAFHMGWTIQMQMNIADKPALYGEIHRVLKPGGRLVFQDIVQGPGGEIITPVPWASDPKHSHLVPADVLRRTIRDAGFSEILWRDTTEAQKAWITKTQAAPEPSEKPPVDIRLVLGPDFGEKRRNANRCLMQDRIGLVQGVFEKRA